MPSAEQTRKRVKNGAIFLGFWTLMGLLFASQFHLSNSQVGNPVSWGRALSFGLADWYVWALWSLPILRLSRRFPLEQSAWKRNVFVHLAGSAVVSVGYVAVRAYVGQWQGEWVGETRPWNELFLPLLLKTWHFNLLFYWIILSAAHVVLYQKQLREREVRAVELEKRLTDARLQALQMQLNPHFLFNTLNSVAALMHRDVEAADRMLVRLGELLRHTLDSTNTQEVPLHQELEFLERYLEIEQIRFGDRLTVRREIEDQTRVALVPNLILQPLVENAIKHGIEPRACPGEVVLKARLSGGQLLLEVSDNGRGPVKKIRQREGIGLANTRARLQQLYGDAHQMEADGQAENGFAVRIRLPFKSLSGLKSSQTLSHQCPV